jgi:internalin A
VDTNVTDAGVVQLKSLTGLQELYIGDTKVTEAGVTEIQRALPNLKIVR